ncbi:MAG TPA: hypothetical protein PLX59_02935 [Candidatus Cloacimonadota bacterium]|nr:hypothetical protein [Candidatus Cloacimonadota bacterium]
MPKEREKLANPPARVALRTLAGGLAKGETKVCWITHSSGFALTMGWVTSPRSAGFSSVLAKLSLLFTPPEATYGRCANSEIGTPI